ncbi:MAG: T9SS C-terminal target domain-containing protein [Bacteroidetes bacterium]|nr:MAG: T9SS C-terminal target domain-containing protein [Bacteroidota bacterium]
MNDTRAYIFCQKAVRAIFIIYALVWPAAYPLFAQNTIEVGGILAENDVWVSDNIYIVTDNVVVFQGITLQIEAGTIVKFNQGRGFKIEGGKLLISGAQADSVKLIPNHTGNEDWNWQGVSLNTVNNPGDVIIEHAIIEKAVIGIKGQASHYAQVKNSRISDSFFIGIEVINGSFWEITNNYFKDNFLGIEIIATGEGNQSANNEISGNTLSNFITNISIQSNSHGASFHNTVEGNTVKNGVNGIWLFNTSQGVSANTIIKRNLIYNNGNTNQGFGIYISADSTFVHNNIFWKNKMAVMITSATASWVSSNNIYESKNGLRIRNNSGNINIENNTFTGIKDDWVFFEAYNDIVFSGNNLFRNDRDSAVVKNFTSFPIDISNNYWGAITDSLVQQLLFHAPDSSGLGEFLYQPFLDNPDTIAPVSAPFGFTWQEVHGTNLFSWYANPETDLLGYRIFYNETGLYSFQDSTGLITDTIFELPDETSENFAIVAYKQQSGVSEKIQFDGLKSPYAFGMQLPFAGNDTVLCRTLSSLQLSKATAPQGISQLLWTTDGDGNFTNPSIIRPRYFPGQQDLAGGEVILTLTIVKNGIIIQDEITLVFAPEPNAFAGYDTYLAEGLSYFTKYATASDFDAILWQTTGDGFFQYTDSIVTFYTPGSSDISNGMVKLVLNALSDFCSPASDTLTLFIRTGYSLNGRAWIENTPLTGHPVLAVLKSENNPQGLPSRFITYSNEIGHFRFENLVEGNYMLYLPADTLNHAGFLPSYYIGQSRWQNAFDVNLIGDVFEIDLRLREIRQDIPQGTGSISGHFKMPSLSAKDKEIFCSDWFGTGDKEFCLQGLSNISILLFSSSRQVIYGHTLTDINGNFIFGNLPFGTYYLEAELAGYHSRLSDQILISPQQQSVENVEFTINSQNIVIFLPEDLQKTAEPLYFPNPVTNELNVQSPELHDETPVTYSIFDMQGRKIVVERIYPLTGLIKIDVRKLLPDTYVIVIGSDDKKHSFIFKKY